MDTAHKQVDKKLEEMEKKISDIYSRAQEEVDKKTSAFFDASQKKDEVQKKKLEAGKITQEQYDNWRKGQLFMGKRYKRMQDQVATEILRASQTAMKYTNGEMPEVYALGYNAFEDAVAGLSGYSFELVDAHTVRNLAMSDKTLLPYKEVNGQKVERWATQKVNSEIMQGVIQGESIPKIAKRLGKVTEMDKNAAIRNARTAMTSAENKGRMNSYKEADDMGIILKKVWIATHDKRVRDWHAALDGVEEDYDQPFVNEYGEIMYPGDPDADAPANVYNCRCALGCDIKGFK